MAEIPQLDNYYHDRPYTRQNLPFIRLTWFIHARMFQVYTPLWDEYASMARDMTAKQAQGQTFPNSHYARLHSGCAILRLLFQLHSRRTYSFITSSPASIWLELIS